VRTRKSAAEQGRTDSAGSTGRMVDSQFVGAIAVLVQRGFRSNAAKSAGRQGFEGHVLAPRHVRHTSHKRRVQAGNVDL
jgi:hypothetical protein